MDDYFDNDGDDESDTKKFHKNDEKYDDDDDYYDHDDDELKVSMEL